MKGTMMDCGALAIGTAWLVLAALFGYGWLRGGNGAWRWRQHRDAYSSNAPLFGMMALVFLIQGFFFLAILLGTHWDRTDSRLIQTVPLLTLFALVAVLRRPWRH
jgi:hypothetical protein